MCLQMILADVVAWQLARQLGHIFYFIVLPMLLLAGIGYVNQRRLKLDLRTLTKMNFDLVVPAVIYVSVVTAQVRVGEVLAAVYFAIAMLACVAVVTYIVARVRKVPSEMHSAMLMTTVFHNSGNYGLPLQSLAFESSGLSSVAVSLQTFYMVVQNFANFTLGVLLVASGRKDRHWRENLLQVVRFPPIYALAAAILTVQIRNALHLTAVPAMIVPFWKVAEYVRDAFVAVALFTLGAQLAAVGKASSEYPIKTSVILRLLVAPAIGMAVIYLAGVSGMLAQVLLISTTTPTAVNTMLLCMEFDNHPGYAARAVLYSTILSPLTVTLVIFLAQGNFLARFAVPPAAQSATTATAETPHGADQPPAALAAQWNAGQQTPARSMALVGLTAATTAAADDSGLAAYRAVLDPLVGAFNSGDFAAAHKDFDAGMLEAIPAERAEAFFSSLKVQYGAMTEIGKGRREGPAVVFPAKFEHGGRLNVSIVLDKDGKIAGLWFLPPAPQIPVPEKHQAKLRLPFRGAWKTYWGGDTPEQNQHHEALNQRYAFDFVVVGPDGSSYRGSGLTNEDYYAFGQEVLSPADGVVTDVISGVRDDVPGSMNPYSALGNAVFIQHREHEVSVLAHLKLDSIRVKVSDRLSAGQVIALCGNSGNSSEPHVHYHLQNTPIIQDGTGIKCFFEELWLLKDGRWQRQEHYSPVRGDIVRPGGDAPQPSSATSPASRPVGADVQPTATSGASETR